jgi:REP element-mobilizing transposase RayT
MEEKIYYKRNLPHYQPSYATFFVTFRLANSLPARVINELKQEFGNEIKKIKKEQLISNEILKIRKKYFGKFDNLLDGSTSGPQWLKKQKIAQIVFDSLFHFDGRDYELLAVSIMPNHVHLVLTLTNNVTRISDSSNQNGVSIYRLTKILQNIKKYSAREANKILQRHGQFWHHESYDHVVRDEKELGNIINYTLQNPVKANLVKNWSDWKWNYCKYFQ